MELLKTNSKLIFTRKPLGSCVRLHEQYIVDKIDNGSIWFKHVKSGQKTVDTIKSVSDAAWVKVNF